MNYKETLNYLYQSVPMFQQVGGKAYKEGLDNTIALDKHFNHPHTKFKTIHVGGTNGKGSTSHTIAAALQAEGYKVGLYTSPHLVDFSERIRINGKAIEEEYVIRFVEEERGFFEPLHPSFFELTTAMAFKYFADNHVDIAVIEVGLGGRLDCTNIISPLLSVITNISFDHVQFLGNTLEAIAGEKAGIIKKNTPVIIGESTEETSPVFQRKAEEQSAPIYWAEHDDAFDKSGIEFQLKGLCQKKNARTIYTALQVLRSCGIHLSDEAVREGFGHVVELTNLMGRWQKLSSSPTVICDTGHNVGGISYIVEQLQQQKYRKLHIVIGMVNDKDITHVLELLPKDAEYYFTQASVARALPCEELAAMAMLKGLKGTTYRDVRSAVEAAMQKSLPEDFIFVGGSNFIIADLLSCRDTFNFN